MEFDKHALRLFCTFSIVFRITTANATPSPPTIGSTAESAVTGSGSGTGTGETGETDEVEMPKVALTEQVMDLNISVSDVPDVDPELTGVSVSDLDKNRIIRDVAYFIRAHKFHDYDRRYHKRAEEATGRLYEEFPSPELRSPHWEVREHCDASFVECLKYLAGIIKLTALRREDDTVTVMREQEWSPANNSEQILAAQRDCQMAQRQDNLTMVPFQGPIGKCTNSR